MPWKYGRFIKSKETQSREYPVVLRERKAKQSLVRPTTLLENKRKQSVLEHNGWIRVGDEWVKKTAVEQNRKNQIDRPVPQGRSKPISIPSVKRNRRVIREA